MYAAMFVVTILINRGYGTAELGRFGLAWAVAQITVQTAVSGFGAIHKREVAYGKRRLEQLVAETLAVRLVSIIMVVCLTALALTILALPWPLTLAILVMIAAKSIEAVGMALAETIQATGGNRTFAALTGLNATILLAAVGTVWALNLESSAIYYAIGGSAAAFTAIAVAVYARTRGLPYIRASAATMARLLRESWALIANAAVYILTGRFAVIAVAALGGETQAGAFTFASGVVGAVAVAAGAIGIVIFPELCRMFVDEPQALRARVYRLFLSLSVVGLAAFALVVIARAPIVRLYGSLPPYAPEVLLVLALGLVPTFASVGANYMFTAIGKQKEGLYLATMNTATLLSLVLTLAYFHGALGAAIAVALSQAVACVVALLWIDRRHLARLAQRQHSQAGVPPRDP